MIGSMTYNDLVQLYFDRSNALQWYWTLYVVIIGGLLAFSSLRQRGDLLTTILITVLFSFFAYKNLGAIQESSLQRFAALKSINEFSGGGADPAELKRVRETLEPTLAPPALEGVRNFHWTSDIVTIVALWSMERRRRKALA
jgi:hypothetical protein